MIIVSSTDDRVDVTVRWNNDAHVASLEISRNSAEGSLQCADIADGGDYDATTVTSNNIEGCVFTNDAGLVFLRWHEADDVYLFQSSGLSQTEALEFLSTWVQL